MLQKTEWTLHGHASCGCRNVKQRTVGFNEKLITLGLEGWLARVTLASNCGRSGSQVDWGNCVAERCSLASSHCCASSDTFLRARPLASGKWLKWIPIAREAVTCSRGALGSGSRDSVSLHLFARCNMHARMRKTTPWRLLRFLQKLRVHSGVLCKWTEWFGIWVWSFDRFFVNEFF